VLAPKSLFLILTSVSLNAVAQVVLRKAMLLAPPLTPAEPLKLALQFLINPYLWAGLCCYALSIGLWLAVLAKVQVSLAYPMLSVGYIVAAVLGAVFLHESLSSHRVLGIGVICIGVFLISRTE
jgi:drug/metabolite transporter (DMT)-like permease